jgi:hypothetical protein
LAKIEEWEVQVNSALVHAICTVIQVCAIVQEFNLSVYLAFPMAMELKQLYRSFDPNAVRTFL